MTSATKQRVAGGIAVVCAFAAVFCLWHVIPYGLGGQIHQVGRWFVAFFAVIAIGLVCAVAYYYYGAKEKRMKL